MLGFHRLKHGSAGAYPFQVFESELYNMTSFIVLQRLQKFRLMGTSGILADAPLRSWTFFQLLHVFANRQISGPTHSLFEQQRGAKNRFSASGLWGLFHRDEVPTPRSLAPAAIIFKAEYNPAILTSYYF